MTVLDGHPAGHSIGTNDLRKLMVLDEQHALRTPPHANLRPAMLPRRHSPTVKFRQEEAARKAARAFGIEICGNDGDMSVMARGRPAVDFENHRLELLVR